MDKFGLIGKTLKHSFSKEIHNLLGNYEYNLYEMNEDEIENFIKSDIKGFNVTVPYKQTIMKYLDEISPSAKSIGAVNTVIKRNGKISGFNTDFYGMIYMINRAGITLENKNVMIFGSGGTSATAQAVSRYLNAKDIVVVSRKGEVNYSNYKNFSSAEILINTTPSGMYPDNYTKVINSIDDFKNLSGVIDVVYNPLMTEFTYLAKQKNIPFSNGLPMLVAQGKFAKEIFFSEENISDKNLKSDIEIEEIIDKIWGNTRNIVLTGMPGSGKTTVGRLLAEKLKMEFIDTDLLVARRENRTIPEIFSCSGEAYFRSIEKEVIKDVGRLKNKVISTGGGVVKDMDNYFPLKQNSTIIYLKRDVEKLSCDNRPLSKNLLAVRQLYEERKDKYMAFSDHVVMNNSDINDTVKGVLDLL